MPPAARPALKYVTVSARCPQHGDLAAAMSTPPVTTKCPKCAVRCAVQRTGHAMRAHEWTFIADDKADATKRSAMKAAHAKRTVSRRGHDGQPPVPEKNPGRPQCSECGAEDAVARGLGRKCYARARAAGTLPPKLGEQPKDMGPARAATTADRPSAAAPTTLAAPAPRHTPSTEPRSDAPRPAQTSAPKGTRPGAASAPAVPAATSAPPDAPASAPRTPRGEEAGAPTFRKSGPKPVEIPDGMITTDEACAIARCKPDTLRAAATAGTLAVTRVLHSTGGVRAHLFRREDVEAFAAARAAAHPSSSPKARAPRIRADGYVVVDVRLGLDEITALAAQGTLAVAMGHLTEFLRLVAVAR